jgi:hypothetical protein
MATTTVRASEAQVARAGLAPAVRAEIEQLPARRRTPGAGRRRIWQSSFADPEPGSPHRLTVNFSYGGLGFSLDPGDGSPPIDFVGPSVTHTYSMPADPKGALVTARLLKGGAEEDTLTFSIPRRDSYPPTVSACWERLDDWA